MAMATFKLKSRKNYLTVLNRSMFGPYIFITAPHSRRWSMKKQINLDHFWQLMTYEDLSDLRLFNLKLLNV